MTERLNGEGKEGRTEEAERRVGGENERGRSDLQSTWCPCAQHSALWSPAAFDLLHGSSHLLPREAGRTKGQSNVASSLVELQLALESCFLAAFTGAKINDLHVYICVGVSVVGELCSPKRCSSPGESDLIWK